MINLSQLLWITSGAVITLLFMGIYRLYWRYFGPGSLQDYISEDEEPEGHYRVLQKIQSPIQKIAVVEEGGELIFYGNGTEMLSTSEDDDKYSEAVVHVPMAAAKKREKILIIGSGGGITTREALRYSDVKEIVAVDIDPEFMKLGMNLKKLTKFNKMSLHDPKVRTVVEDGRAFLENSKEKWDVIILDLPEPNKKSPQLCRLFSKEFYKIVQERLESDGVMVVACSVVSYMPKYYWTVQATIKESGFNILPYHYDYIVEYGEDWGFCLAANRLIKPEDIKIAVKTRYLTPDRLKDMFNIPFYLSNNYEVGKIQTDNNKSLVKIVEESMEY